LSFDSELSQAVAAAFPKGMKGAIIVSKPETGEILAMYSSPSYSLNDFAGGMDQQQYAALANNPDQPLFNRAIGGVYPPGSTYKIVTALAGLETGIVTASTTFEDTGVITIGPYSFPNWFFIRYGRTDGMVDVVKALAHSNDVYFYKEGEKLGIAKLDDWSKKVGLGNLLGIQLPGEATGLLPNPLWKRKQFTSPEDLKTRQNEWYLGDTYHMAIGQGYLLTTPLQVNNWTSIIANGGNLCPPTIEKINSDITKTHVCKPLALKDETLKLIIEGMRQACDTGGTAYPLFGFGVKSQALGPKQNESSASAQMKRIPIACKTGTAEFGDPQNLTHAWLTLFAPIPAQYLPPSLSSDPSVVSGDPEISMTVLVEAGGEGSDVAAPVAKKILESWFTR
jgi:penicillin-binding protein 2